MLLQPLFRSDSSGVRRGAKEIMPTAVAVFPRRRGCWFSTVRLLAESCQRIKLAEQGDDRFTLAKAGDKRIGDSTSVTA